MYCVRNITEDLYWVGANDHRTHLFENIHPIPLGVSYNAYRIRTRSFSIRLTGAYVASFWRILSTYWTAEDWII